MNGHTVVSVGKEVVKRIGRDQLTDRAGAMTYNTLMALFPGLLLIVSIMGLIGQGQIYRDVISEVEKVAPRDVAGPIVDVVNGAASAGNAAIIPFVISLVLGLNGASGALAAAGRSLNVVLGVKDDRSFVRRKIVDMAWTLVLIVLAIVAMVLIFLGGQFSTWLFDQIGLGSWAATVWNFGRWPLAVLVAMLIYAIVYRVAPDGDERQFRFVSPGAVIAVLLWALASGAFFLYVSNFSSYSRTYGAFAGAVVLLIWLWLTNLCLLVGAEINAILDERRHGVSHTPEGVEMARQRSDQGAEGVAPPGDSDRAPGEAADDARGADDAAHERPQSPGPVRG